jgi:hypothetical protein
VRVAGYSFSGASSPEPFVCGRSRKAAVPHRSIWRIAAKAIGAMILTLCTGMQVVVGGTITQLALSIHHGCVVVHVEVTRAAYSFILAFRFRMSAGGRL